MKSDEKLDPKKLKFTIDQLRKDKIIMAAEMTGVNTSILLGALLVVQFLDGFPEALMIAIGCTFGILYSLYASFGNLRRAREIKRLEDELIEVEE